MAENTKPFRIANKGLTPEERLQRVLQKQKEIEEKMAAKSAPKPIVKAPPAPKSTTVDIEREKQEQAYQEAQQKRLEEARLRKEAELAALEKADRERRMKDASLKGYLHETPNYYYGYRHYSEPSQVSKSEEELRLEEEVKKDKKESGQLEGLNWVKTEYGWNRGQDLQKTYKAPPTHDSLPSWLYDELNLKFGLRRIGTKDFDYASIMLRKLVDVYFDSNKSLQKRFIVDTLNAYKLLRRNAPETIPLKNLQSVSDLCNTIAEKLKPELTIKQVLKRNTANEEKDLQELKEAIDYLQMIKTKAEDKRVNCVDDLSEFSYLPIEIILQIFSYLTDPVDLCSASVVSLYWNFLASEDRLYKELIRSQFPAVFLKSDDYKSQYVGLYVRKRTGREWTAYGFFQCKKCDQYYWAASDAKQREHIRSAKHMDPQKIIEDILSRKYVTVSDVILNY